MKNLIILPSSDSIKSKLKKSAICDILLTDTMCYGTINTNNTEVKINIKQFYTDLNYFGELNDLLLNTKKYLSNYDLKIVIDNQEIDLTDAIVSDCSYEVFSIIGIVNRIRELNKEKSYERILIFGNNNQYKLLSKVLSLVDLPVKHFVQRSFVSKDISQRIKILLKGAYLNLKLKSNVNIENKILTYFGASYYYKKISDCKAFDILTINGVTTKDQLKGINSSRNFNLINWKSFIYPIIKTKFKGDNNKKDIISIIIDQIIDNYYTKSQLLAHSFYSKLSKTRPLSILFTNPSFIEAGVLIQVCKDLNIQTLLLNGGAFSIIQQYITPQVNNYLVWGNYYKDVLIENGIDSERIIISGSPFINFENRNISDKKIQSIGIVSTGFTNGYGNEYWRVIAKGIEHIKNAKFVIRPHPLEDNNSFYDYLKIWFKNISYEIDQSFSLNDFLFSCELIIHQSSTVGIEAIARGIPSIDIDPFDVNKNAPFNCFTIPVKIQTENQLQGAINFYMNENWHQTFSEQSKLFIDNLYNLTGKESLMTTCKILEADIL
jgi:hypothetical protein